MPGVLDDTTIKTENHDQTTLVNNVPKIDITKKSKKNVQLDDEYVTVKKKHLETAIKVLKHLKEDESSSSDDESTDCSASDCSCRDSSSYSDDSCSSDSSSSCSDSSDYTSSSSSSFYSSDSSEF